jgi:hypothetical protein
MEWQERAVSSSQSQDRVLRFGGREGRALSLEKRLFAHVQVRKHAT